MTTDAERSRVMRAVRSKDTAPEMTVRRLVHSLGYRYRLHRSDLPGKPDLVFSGRHKVIFVHGCFWHGHGCARGARVPVTNVDYWKKKIARNVERDAETSGKLSTNGWLSLTIWECELKIADRPLLKKRIQEFLSV